MESVHNIHHRYFLHKKWNPEILEYYFYQTCNRIAHTLVVIFVPVYLYSELQYSLFQIAFFYLLWQLTFIPFVPFSAKVIEKFGVKHTMALYLPFSLLFLLLLQFLTPGFWNNLWLILLVLLSRNVPKAFNETAEIVFVTKNVLKKNHQGSSLANIRIVLILANLLSPLIGGAIAYFFGFRWLFAFAGLFFLLAAIPLFLTKDKHFTIHLKPVQIVSIAFHRLPGPMILAESGRVFANTVIWILWPIFIYIIVKSTLDLGALVTASGIVSILIAYYIGKKIDKKTSSTFFKNSVKISTGIFYIRTIFADPFLIAASDVANRVFEPVLMVPYEKYLYGYLSSINDIIQITNAKVLVTEFTYLVGVSVLCVIFGITGFFGVDEHLFTFIGIFVFFGLSILFMAKISQLQE